MPIDWLVLGGALLSGLLGGAHCAAMCGGIATSLSLQQRGGWWMASSVAVLSESARPVANAATNIEARLML